MLKALKYNVLDIFHNIFDIFHKKTLVSDFTKSSDESKKKVIMTY